jgi:hypothetical protein
VNLIFFGVISSCIFGFASIRAIFPKLNIFLRENKQLKEG